MLYTSCSRCTTAFCVPFSKTTMTVMSIIYEHVFLQKVRSVEYHLLPSSRAINTTMRVSTPQPSEMEPTASLPTLTQHIVNTRPSTQSLGPTVSHRHYAVAAGPPCLIPQMKFFTYTQPGKGQSDLFQTVADLLEIQAPLH